MINDTYMTVEKQGADGSWMVVATDANWETKVHWKRVGTSESTVTCEWNTPADVAPGSYRIGHRAFYKGSAVSKTITPYAGLSSVFTITSE